MKKDKKIIGLSILTAIASSLCCITPMLALISGTTSFASTFSWMEPFRPYLIVFTVLILCFAWYQKLKPKKTIDCNCETNQKSSFLQSKLFLSIVTVFAVLMTLVPYYSSVFYSDTKKEVLIIDKSAIKNINLNIKGMTCASCEEHINHAVNQLNGVISVETSYKNGISKISFDKTKTSLIELEKAVNKTGYTVFKTKNK